MMFVAKPDTALWYAQEEKGRTGPDAHSHYWFRMQRDEVARLLKHRDAKPTDTQLSAASKLLEGITGLAWPSDRIQDLLCLYPRLRIAIAFESDLEVELSNAAGHFFLGTSWPTFGDNIDAKAWLAVLQQQAVLMGYTKVSSKKRR
ncbi:hypothetical protein [Pseudomonas sp. NPDC096950]|uniref:hypothetical protein n=1 Tax=Pseudomonas sp. NPDC096950 TaxID=3364485 RepID=UPI00383A30DE